MPDNSLCTGPERLGANCLKHVAQQSRPGRAADTLARMPDSLVAVGIVAQRMGMFRWHGMDQYVGAVTSRAGFLKKRMNMVDRIVAPTKLMAEMLIKNGADPARIVVHRYGIDFATRPIERQRTRRLRVGFIGTLYEHKGAHILLEAVAKLPTAPLEISIYGSLEEFPAYTKRIKDLACVDARVRLMGTFPNAQIADVLEDLDVLVVPSIWYENAPLVIYSAHAFGCPVIASDLGGMSEAVRDGVDGLLFKAGDSTALARLLGRLAADRGIAAALSKGCKRPRSAADYVDVLEAIYAELTPAARKRPETTVLAG